MANEIITNTQGGAYNEGEVNTGGGDFVGRDKVTQIDQISISQAPDPSPGPPNNPLWRWIVTAGIVVALVAGLVAIVSDSMNIQSLLATVTPIPAPTVTPLAFAPAANSETLIVIAKFHEPSASKAEPHRVISRGIKEASEEVGVKNLRVEIAPTELNADQRAEAEALGRQYNANIVIWGESTAVQVLVNFLNLKQPDFRAAEIKISEPEDNQLNDPKAYTRFILSDLPGKLTFLSFFALGQSFFQAENYSQAKDVIEQGIASLGTEVRLDELTEAYYWLGWLYQGPLNDLNLAIQNYTKVIELDPTYVPAYNNRGLARRDLDYLVDAIQDFTKAIELDPKYARAYYNRGLALSDQGNLTAAAQDYTKAIELDPEYISAYNNLCWCRSLLEQANEAIAACERAVELAPDDGSLRDARGLARAVLGDYRGAIEDFEFFVDWSKVNGQYNQYGPIREAWITELKAGRNPFDQATLEKLRNE